MLGSWGPCLGGKSMWCPYTQESPAVIGSINAVQVVRQTYLPRWLTYTQLQLSRLQSLYSITLAIPLNVSIDIQYFQKRTQHWNGKFLHRPLKDAVRLSYPIMNHFLLCKLHVLNNTQSGIIFITYLCNRYSQCCGIDLHIPLLVYQSETWCNAVFQQKCSISSHPWLKHWQGSKWNFFPPVPYCHLRQLVWSCIYLFPAVMLHVMS